MTKNTTRMVRIALFTALICVGAYFCSNRSLFRLVFKIFCNYTALLLPAKDAALSVLIYLFIGLAGLPVFAQFNGGLQTVFKPSFGFLIGFVVGRHVISKIVGDSRDYKKIFLATVVGEIIFYIVESHICTIYCMVYLKHPVQLQVFATWTYSIYSGIYLRWQSPPPSHLR